MHRTRTGPRHARRHRHTTCSTIALAIFVAAALLLGLYIGGLWLVLDRPVVSS